MKKTTGSEYDMFISYRRDGGESTAKILRDKLTELGYSVFFDVESLRSGDFNKKLYEVIEGCRDFILVLSPGALDRCVNEDDWVRLEIEHALEKEKNVNKEEYVRYYVRLYEIGNNREETDEI